MNADQLKAQQAPLKARYKDQPDAAVITLKADGVIGEGVTCSVQTGKALITAGLHPATGGNGLSACSGDMLLEALVACAGVTLNAVATSIGVNLKKGSVHAEGDLDFRGTLGVAKDAPVGFKAIRMRFDLDSDATPEQLDTLIKLTERYCVVFQTIKQTPQLSVSRSSRPAEEDHSDKRPLPNAGQVRCRHPETRSAPRCVNIQPIASSAFHPPKYGLRHRRP